MAVKIKLKRLGKIRAPYYRIIVADARTKRDGRAIEEIGKYHPKSEPSFIEVNSERAQHWLSVGAQPTDPVRKILEITGDWQKFKGLPGAEGTLRTAAPKESRKDIFAAAVKETLGDAAAPPKGKSRSAASKDSASKDSDTEKSGKAAGKDSSSAKADKPAKAKAAETSGKAKSGDSGDAAKGKPKEAAKSGKGDAAEAQAGTPAAEAAKPAAEAAKPPAETAKLAETAKPAAETAKPAEAAEPAAETADSGSASGD